jgi:hypothetical protein
MMFGRKQREIEQLKLDIDALRVAIEEAARARGVLIEGTVTDTTIEGDVVMVYNSQVANCEIKGDLRYAPGARFMSIMGNYFGQDRGQELPVVPLSADR